MKRRPTNIPHIPGQRARSRNVPDLRGRKVKTVQPRTAKRGKSTFMGRSKPSQKKGKSGCGFPMWLIFFGAIAWNVFDDIEWSRFLDNDDAVESPVEPVVPDEVPPLADPAPPPIATEPVADAPASQAQPPRANLAGLFTSDDYPSAALRNGDEGIVRARLLIGADGRVRDCTVMRGSGSAALDAGTCRIFTQRARFAPARDEEGNAIEAEYLAPAVSWQIPE